MNKSYGTTISVYEETNVLLEEILTNFKQDEKVDLPRGARSKKAVLHSIILEKYKALNEVEQCKQG